jgi:type I restriction enzyme S subunit
MIHNSDNYFFKSIPSSWEFKPLHAVVCINPEKLTEDTDPQLEFDYVDIGNVSFGEGIVNKEFLTFEKAPTRARRIVQEGDTIVSTVRTYLKSVAMCTGIGNRMVVSTGFAVLRPNKHLNAEFLYRLVQSEPFIQQIVAKSVGVSYPAINASEIGKIFVPIPPVETQGLIVSFLDSKLSAINRIDNGAGNYGGSSSLVGRISRALKSYRAALITAAVTGQIDVTRYRGEALCQ